MRKEKEILKEVAQWASNNKEIRTVILTGSRTSPEIGIDLFSDYDIEIGVNDLTDFLENEEWLSFFGNVLTCIRKEYEGFWMRMVLYKDYVRIDFKIYAITYFEQLVEREELPKHWDRGYFILIDKNGITKDLKLPTHSSYTIRKPTEDEFLVLVNDFWWDTTYVAKSLWRNELYYAKYMLDSIIRFSYLQRMIEWNIGLRYNWAVSTNKNGRFFKRYLSEESWIELEETFCGSAIEENWIALFATIRMFRQLAATIATELHYSYPKKTDIEIGEYIEKIRSLNRNATDIE